jgi:hypothetical protein
MLTVFHNTDPSHDPMFHGWIVGYAQEDGTFDAASAPFATQADAQAIADEWNEG